MLQIREVYVNETKGWNIGECEWYQPWTDNIKLLFKDLQKEYGRCVSKIYQDLPDGTADAIGWYFEKPMAYEDERDKHDTYVRGVWVFTRYHK